MNSICIKCGSEKREYSDQCDACNFQPESVRELAMSFVLSKDILADGWQTGDVNLPRDKDEIYAIANMLKRGEKYKFEDSAIDYVVKGMTELNQLTWSKILFIYFLPSIVVIGFGIYLIIKFVSTF